MRNIVITHVVGFVVLVCCLCIVEYCIRKKEKRDRMRYCGELPKEELIEVVYMTSPPLPPSPVERGETLKGEIEVNGGEVE